MKAVWLYRITAILFCLFAAGHTWGFLNFRPLCAEGEAVRQAMVLVRFQVDGSTFSYGGFYRGFGLYVTLYLLFSGFLAGHLSRLTRAAPATIGALGWVFFAVQIGSLVLSWTYFSTLPALFSGLAAACL